MKGNPVLYKTLVVGIIVLFIGIGVQPAFAVTSDTSDIDDDCNLCPKKVSKSHLVLIESLLKRLEKYDNQLSVLSKQYPESDEKIQELSEIIVTLRDIKIKEIIDCYYLQLIVIALAAPFILYVVSLSNARFYNLKLLLTPLIIVISIPAMILGKIWVHYCYTGPT